MGGVLPEVLKKTFYCSKSEKGGLMAQFPKKLFIFSLFVLISMFLLRCHDDDHDPESCDWSKEYCRNRGGIPKDCQVTYIGYDEEWCTCDCEFEEE